MADWVTLQEIAQRCNLSRATVDRALNNRGRIGEKTRQQVLAVAREMGYFYQPPLRRRIGKSGKIGMILPDFSPFHARLAESLEKQLVQEGFQAEIFLSSYHPGRQQLLLEELLKRDADGILLVPAGERAESVAEYLPKIPLVSLARPLIENGGGVDQILPDYKGAALRAVQYLTELGHRKICFCHIWKMWGQWYAYREQVSAYKQALRRCGLDYHPDWVMLRRDSSEKIIPPRFFDSMQAPTAALCVNEGDACLLVKELWEQGITVPRDFSVLSFCEQPWEEDGGRTITAFPYPYEEIAWQAVRRLLDRIAGEEDSPSVERIAPAFSIGESCAVSPGLK